MIETILTGGGAAALVVALAYAGRLGLDAWKERHSAPTAATSSAVTDAATANSLLLAALQEERVEVQRLSGEVENLRISNSRLYEQMRAQRQDYERELSELRQQLTEVSDRLAGLQTRLRDDLPPDHPAR